MSLDRRIDQRVAQNKAARMQTQDLLKMASSMTGLTPAEVVELCEARIELSERGEEMNEHRKTLLEIARALDYEPPYSAVLMEAINHCAAKAKAHGYEWSTLAGYLMNDDGRALNMQQFKQRIDETAAQMQQPQQRPLLSVEAKQEINYE